jgi:hypothetical protein
MAALDPANVRRLVQMALQAVAIRFRRGQMGRIDDIRLIRRCGVLPTRPVARFARLGIPPAAFLSIHHFVRTLLESVVDIFVARLASFRANKG